MGSREELLAKAEKPAQEALRLHSFYRGKMQTLPRCAVRDIQDFAVWYTPGVAKACQAIHRDREKVYEYTSRWNTVAVISDGTRVLGLGDIGPEAAMPVMEGKALLFKYLGGVDAVPLCLDAKDPEEFIRVVKALEPSFGGINLEDIAQPKCFTILDVLRREMEIPVWHDDQQGTAAVTVAGLMNALRLVGKRIEEIKVALIGAGAANVRIAHLLVAAGVSPGNLYVVDSKGLLGRHREDLERHKEKWELCLLTNAENRKGGAAEALRGADAVIALSTPGPGVLKPEWIKDMASDPIVFACANPVPEIWPWEAKEAGAKIVATGRSDFPNQVNNSLGFPAIFRGALDVRATTITDEMCLEAARALAQYAVSKGLLSEDYLLPTMEDWEVYPAVAAAVGAKAVEQGVARVKLGYDELYAQAKATIEQARAATRVLMETGLIPPPHSA